MPMSIVGRITTMAYVVKRPRGSWEIRESVTTRAGPRARTLATFRELTSEVVDKALARAHTDISEEEVLDAALRAGAILAASAPDDAAARLLAQLAQGQQPSPALRRLLRKALNKDRLPESARWIGASLEERGKALHDLLLLADRLPARKRKLQTVPRLDSRSA